MVAGIPNDPLAGATAIDPWNEATRAARASMWPRVRDPFAIIRLKSASCGNSRILTAYSTAGPGPSTMGALGAAANGDNVEIHAGSKAPIETQLLLAEMAAPFERPEVEKVERDSLLDFVGVDAREQDVGDVRFNEGDGGDRVPVRRWMCQPLDQARLTAGVRLRAHNFSSTFSRYWAMCTGQRFSVAMRVPRASSAGGSPCTR